MGEQKKNSSNKIYKKVLLIAFVIFLVYIFYTPAKILIHNIISDEPINYTSYKINNGEVLDKEFTAQVVSCLSFEVEGETYYLILTEEGEEYFIDEPSQGNVLKQGDVIHFVKNRLSHDIIISEIEANN